MRREDVVKGSVFCILVAVIILGGMVVRAEAGTLKLSMADFTADGESSSDYFKDFIDGRIQGGWNSGGSAILVAPVKFPSTATKVKNVVVYVEDDNGTFFFWAILYGVDMTTGGVINLGEVESNILDYSTSIQALTLNLTAPKLNKNYQYYLSIRVYNKQYFYGAKITY